MVRTVDDTDDGSMTNEHDTHERDSEVHDADVHDADLHDEALDVDGTDDAWPRDTELDEVDQHDAEHDAEQDVSGRDDTNPDDAAQPEAADPPTGPPPGPPPGSPPPPIGPYGPYGSAGSTGPVPPRAQRPSPIGLTRDPYATLGGVASGIAHRYGLSTALVRLAFVILLFVSCFFALPIYLAAWAIIPRATVWPPEAIRAPGQKFSSRDLGVIALVGGLFAFLIFGVDGVGSVLVALAFVTAGVALLLQHDRNPPPPAPDAVVASYAAAPRPATATPTGQPVPPPSAGRKWFIGLSIGAVILFFASLIVIPIALLVGSDFADIDIETGTFDLRFDDEVALVDSSPTEIADLPDSIDARAGDITIDLSGIDVADFEALTNPAELDIDLGNGDVDIVLPAGLEYSIVADVNHGDIDIDLDDAVTSLDRTSRGEVLTVVNDDASFDLRIDLGEGDIKIETAS